MMRYFGRIALAITLALLTVGTATYVIAQTTFPTLSKMTGSELFEVYGLATPTHVYVSARQITSQTGYYKSSPATGFTYTFANTVTRAAFSNTSADSTATITLAPSPSDGARECMFSVGGVTTLTLNANAGQSINNAVTSLTADVAACYLYSASNTTWDRD